jgi:hypothetical protein
MDTSNKARKTLMYTKDQTPLMPLSGTRKVVRTPTDSFETADNVEVHIPEEIITDEFRKSLLESTKRENLIITYRSGKATHSRKIILGSLLRICMDTRD